MNDLKVSPDEGLFVNMEGVVEATYVSSDPYYEPPGPEDLFYLQNDYIPEDFCQKDRETGVQAVFECKVCDCELKSVTTLKAHVVGNKHVRKACERKRQIMGMPAEPLNAPKVKTIKREKPSVDVNLTLKERLEDSALPAIGLEFVKEVLNPDDMSAPRLYTCTLTGCKSTWGTSDDLFNHVLKFKHQKNFFKNEYPDDPRVDGLARDQLLRKAQDFVVQKGEDEQRDYSVIMKVKDKKLYMELKNRPDDWSEKKAKMGLVGNANKEPLGRRGRDWSVVRYGLDEKAWKDWSHKMAKDEWLDWVLIIQEGIADCKNEVDQYNEGGRNHEDVKSSIHHYRSLVISQQDKYVPGEEVAANKVENICGEMLKELRNLELRVEAGRSRQNRCDEEAEDRFEKKGKRIQKMIEELEDEMIRYHSRSESRCYINIKARMRDVKNELETLPYDNRRKVKLNKRLGDLWENWVPETQSAVTHRSIVRHSNTHSLQQSIFIQNL